MEFVKNARIETDDFYYDLFEGGYIEPGNVLKNQDDIYEVLRAIKIISEFKEAAEEQDIIQYL